MFHYKTNHVGIDFHIICENVLLVALIIEYTPILDNIDINCAHIFYETKLYSNLLAKKQNFKFMYYSFLRNTQEQSTQQSS